MCKRKSTSLILKALYECVSVLKQQYSKNMESRFLKSIYSDNDNAQQSWWRELQYLVQVADKMSKPILDSLVSVHITAIKGYCSLILDS